MRLGGVGIVAALLVALPVAAADPLLFAGVESGSGGGVCVSVGAGNLLDCTVGGGSGSGGSGDGQCDTLKVLAQSGAAGACLPGGGIIEEIRVIAGAAGHYVCVSSTTGPNCSVTAAPTAVLA